jgi:hypothetical protein
MARFTYEYEELEPHEFDIGTDTVGYVIRDTGLPVAICQDRDWAEAIAEVLNAAGN